MTRRKISGLLACALIICTASFTWAFVPDYSQSTASTAYHSSGGCDTISLFVMPNGTGNHFSLAYDEDGAIVNATIWLFMRYADGSHVPNFPQEDLWLVSPGLAPCTGGTIADSSTNDEGCTSWGNPLRAGGYSSEEGLTQVYISGEPLESSAGMYLRFNSPDINGDGIVNLADVGIFVTDYYGEYNYRSDFVCDGYYGLNDVRCMAIGIGIDCQ